MNINNLHVSVGDHDILKGVTLSLKKGKVVAIMGPNGSGKSTLANTLAGHPRYTVTQGSIMLDEQDITHEKPDVRAKRGLFLSMQHTPEISGVSIANFLRLAVNAMTGEEKNPLKFHKELVGKMEALRMDPAFLSRYVNVGFSGGEKKRFEMLQLAVLNPSYAILDETDSGLDVDAFKIVAEGISHFRQANTGILLITHYNRMLEYVVPDEVHVMVQGAIVRSGGKELAKEIEEKGYGEIIQSRS